MMPSIKEQKEQLRKERRSLRLALSPQQREQRSRQLVNVLDAFLAALEVDCVGVYAPRADEPLWEASECLKGKSLAFPDFRAGKMEYFVCRSEELLLSKNFKVEILTPPQTARRVVPQAVLVPGLAFSPSGARLGRGGGFFDRFLKTYPGVSIGVCFATDCLPQIPQDHFDQNVQVVVTDQGLYREE